MSVGTWVGIGTAVAALIALALTWSRRREYRPDLGSVSDAWIVHHRAGQTHDPGH